MAITILGLGFGEPRRLTMEAYETLQNAREIFLSTHEQTIFAGLPQHLTINTFDHLRAMESDTDALASAIAAELIVRGAQADILYTVPGDPLFEFTTQKIVALAREKNIPTRIITSAGLVDAMCVTLNIDPLERGLQIVDARRLARQYFPSLDPDRPAFVGQLHNRAVASACQQVLLMLYPPDHLVTRVNAVGAAKQSIDTTPLVELDRAGNLGWSTTLYVPPLARPSSLNALGQVVARLRAPDGCSWDRAQTHQSLRKDFLEECYEVLETLDQNDMPHLREELGDLLLHIFLQTQIATESDEFRLTDVVADIAAKLVRRHPHVFGDVKVNGMDEIIGNWERIKQTENDGTKKKSKMPRGLPALMRAQKIAKRGKIKGGAREVAAAVKKLAHARNRERAFGEALFALAAYASAKGIDAESALREATAKRIP